MTRQRVCQVVQGQEVWPETQAPEMRSQARQQEQAQGNIKAND